MLDDFMESQFITYSLLINSIKNNKISHAYLIDTNNNEDAFDFVLSFVKVILCDNHYSNSLKCGNCKQCMRIDNGNYTEIKIIKPESTVIKKEQLLELQSEFSRTSLEGNRRVYIIRDCDKMNKQAANSLLKFLEEPDEGIIAVLLTDNINGVLSTIKSRCQIMRLAKKKNDYSDNVLVNFANSCCSSKEEVLEFLKNDANKEKIDNILSFIDYYEENGLDILIIMKKMWYNTFPTREDSLLAILLLINFYYDVLKYKFDIGEYFFAEYISLIEKIANNNTVLKLINKINVCIEARESLRYNLNVNLLVDDMVIKLGE